MHCTENVKVQFVIVAQIVVGQEETWLATFKTCFTFGSEAIKHANKKKDFEIFVTSLLHRGSSYLTLGSSRWSDLFFG